MAELSVQQLKAAALTLVSLVDSVTLHAPKEMQRKVAKSLIVQIFTKHYRGFPGKPRRLGAAPTPTDTNALQIMDVVTKVWGRRLAVGIRRGA